MLLYKVNINHGCVWLLWSIVCLLSCKKTNNLFLSFWFCLWTTKYDYLMFEAYINFWNVMKNLWSFSVWPVFFLINYSWRSSASFFIISLISGTMNLSIVDHAKWRLCDLHIEICWAFFYFPHTNLSSSLCLLVLKKM